MLVLQACRTTDRTIAPPGQLPPPTPPRATRAAEVLQLVAPGRPGCFGRRLPPRTARHLYDEALVLEQKVDPKDRSSDRDDG